MSVFSNPAGGAAEGARAYIAAVLDLVKEREPLDVLASTVERCRDLTASRPTAELARPEAEGKWSAAGIIQHLADSELVWGFRLRKVLAEDRPTLAGFDQDRWADRLGYATADRDAALAMFSSLRSANLALLRSASDEDLERVGVHVERGEESVRHMMRLYAGHDLAHIRQLERVLAASGARSTA